MNDAPAIVAKVGLCLAVVMYITLMLTIIGGMISHKYPTLALFLAWPRGLYVLGSAAKRKIRSCLNAAQERRQQLRDAFLISENAKEVPWYKKLGTTFKGMPSLPAGTVISFYTTSGYYVLCQIVSTDNPSSFCSARFYMKTLYWYFKATPSEYEDAQHVVTRDLFTHTGHMYVDSPEYQKHCAGDVIINHNRPITIVSEERIKCHA